MARTIAQTPTHKPSTPTLQALLRQLVESLPRGNDAHDYLAWEDEHYQLSDQLKDTMPSDWRMPRAEHSALHERVRAALPEDLRSVFLKLDDNANYTEMHAIRAGILIGAAIERHQRQQHARKTLRLIPRDAQRAHVNSHERRSA